MTVVPLNPRLGASVDRPDICALLKPVSRAFYLTLRILPSETRHTIGLAYLLARAADTIADTRSLACESRKEALLRLRDAIRGGAELPHFETRQASAGERRLLESLPQLQQALALLSPQELSLVRTVVTTLISGMEFDLQKFPSEDSGRLAGLETEAELDRYTYLVAGCVGEFWTEVTYLHHRRLRHWNRESVTRLGTRFGKALQLTNVLRDLARDLRIGRCYLPQEQLLTVGLAPADLLDPRNESRLKPVYDLWVERALAHFVAAEQYVLAIPRSCPRLRLAAFWPIAIGLATLRRLLSQRGWLQPERVIKVGRPWVYTLLVWSLPVVLSDSLVRYSLGHLRREVEKKLCK